MGPLRLRDLSAVCAAACLAVAGEPAAQDRLRTVEGRADGDACGVVIRDVGDLDKDGHDDYAVGAPGGDTHAKDTGRVLVYSGASDRVIHKFVGRSPGDSFGYSLAGAGDVNGDGYDDLIVGAPYEDHEVADAVIADAGCAHVISGRDGEVLYTFGGPSEGDALGWSVGALGDVNRDGHADVVVGAPFHEAKGSPDAGLVQVFSGKTGALLYQLRGREPGDRFGWSVCNAGDQNGDRAGDLAVGVEGGNRREVQAGATQLFSGKSGQLLRTLRTGQEQDYFGASIAPAGDVDQDGRADLLIGAWNGLSPDEARTGTALVISGRSGKVLLRVAGSAPHDRFGAAVAGVGDIDGDSHPDIAVGAPQEPETGSGYVRVFSGKTGAVLFTLVGESIGDGFGTSISSHGDRNEDGVRDLLVGAPGLRGRGGWHVFTCPAR